LRFVIFLLDANWSAGPTRHFLVGVGIVLAVYVAWEWFVVGISHESLTVVSAFAILFGLQMVMFGALSDLMVSLHREQRRHIDRLENER